MHANNGVLSHQTICLLLLYVARRRARYGLESVMQEGIIQRKVNGFTRGRERVEGILFCNSNAPAFTGDPKAPLLFALAVAPQLGNNILLSTDPRVDVVQPSLCLEVFLLPVWDSNSTGRERRRKREKKGDRKRKEDDSSATLTRVFRLTGVHFTRDFLWGEIVSTSPSVAALPLCDCNLLLRLCYLQDVYDIDPLIKELLGGTLTLCLAKHLVTLFGGRATFVQNSLELEWYVFITPAESNAAARECILHICNKINIHVELCRRSRGAEIGEPLKTQERSLITEIVNALCHYQLRSTPL